MSKHILEIVKSNRISDLALCSRIVNQNFHPHLVSLLMNQLIRVLIVDDQLSVRKGLKAILAFYPEILVVGEAANGAEAIKLIIDQQPQVVIMDLQMPVMDGVTATRLIKTEWPTIKVIVLTIQASRRAEALAAGADTFLIKGNEPEALQKAILN